MINCALWTITHYESRNALWSYIMNHTLWMIHYESHTMNNHTLWIIHYESYIMNNHTLWIIHCGMSGGIIVLVIIKSKCENNKRRRTALGAVQRGKRRLNVTGRWHQRDTRPIYLTPYKTQRAWVKVWKTSFQRKRGDDIKGTLGLYIWPRTKHSAHDSSPGVATVVST